MSKNVTKKPAKKASTEVSTKTKKSTELSEKELGKVAGGSFQWGVGKTSGT